MLTIGDSIVLILCILFTLALYQHFWFKEQQPEPAAYLVIHTANTTQSIALPQQRTISISGALGTSLLQIDQQQVRFLSSPCHNKLCIAHGWIKHTGEVNACVPNKISIQLLTQNRTFDSINY